MDQVKLKAMLASYGRSFLSAAAALYATGNADPKSLVVGALAATLPVAIRAINPKDPAFGLAAKAVQEVLEKEAKKAKKKSK